ncbi:hypothetical protein KAI32_00535 [Candidatus Pacearchaeota archaeon]|nr:hypothetical protein [Candidatus Pacearchaeota archaeon]
MRISELIDELEETETYKKFKDKNPSTFFSAGFFILDLESKTEKIQLDFFLPKQNRACPNQSKSQISEGRVCPNQSKSQISEGRIASFEYPFKEPKIYDEEIKPMQPQTTEIKIDIDDLESTCKKIIKENNSLIIFTKIIAILKDNQWNLTCMDDMLGIVRIKLNAITGELIDFNKGSLMDMMKVEKK